MIFFISTAIANLNDEALEYERIASEDNVLRQTTGDEDVPLNDDEANEEINLPSVIRLLSTQRSTADQRPRNSVADIGSRRRDGCLPRTEVTLLPDYSQRNETSSLQRDEKILCQQELIPAIRSKDSSSIDVRNRVSEDQGNISDEDKRGQRRKRSIDKNHGPQRHIQQGVDRTENDPPARSQARLQIEVLPPRSVNDDQLANNVPKTLPQSTKLKTRHIKHAIDENTGKLSTATNISDHIDIGDHGDHGGKINRKISEKLFQLPLQLIVVIHLKLDFLDESKDDDSGWVTESSACFEDTLFEDSPQKKRRGSGQVKPSSQVAAFVSFGGNKEESSRQVESTQQLSLKQHSGIQDAIGIRKCPSSQPQQPVVKDLPKSPASETERESYLKKTSRSTLFPITYKGMEAPTVPSVKVNSRVNSAMIDVNQVDQSRAALMSPPRRMLAQKVSSKSALMQSADESAPKSVTVTETAVPHSDPVQRKPLSSVGLSALKTKSSSGKGGGHSGRGRRGLSPSRSTDAIDIGERSISAQTSSHPR
jgi:hypothetical protein